MWLSLFLMIIGIMVSVCLIDVLIMFCFLWCGGFSMKFVMLGFVLV